jgi:predicted nucleic acid-binding protein
MDTNVLIAALRSHRGASFELFKRLLAGEWTAVISNHLLFEYEEIMKRDAPLLGLNLEGVDELLNAVCARAEVWPLSHEWQPILHDADDEPLAQLAVESGTLRIVTHNVSHLQPSIGLGIELLKPRDFLAKLKKTT